MKNRRNDHEKKKSLDNRDTSTGGDSSSFYGVGAAVLTTDGTVKVTNSTITTDAADADGKSVTILDTNGKILANGESGYTITVDSLTE